MYSVLKETPLVNRYNKRFKQMANRYRTIIRYQHKGFDAPQLLHQTAGEPLQVFIIMLMCICNVYIKATYQIIHDTIKHPHILFLAPTPETLGNNCCLLTYLINTAKINSKTTLQQ